MISNIKGIWCTQMGNGSVPNNTNTLNSTGTSILCKWVEEQGYNFLCRLGNLDMIYERKKTK